MADAYTGGAGSITDLGLGSVDVLDVAFGATVNATRALSWVATAASRNGRHGHLASATTVNLNAASGSQAWSVTNAGTAGGSLTGSAQDNTLAGGSGSDLFVLSQGGQDVISLAGWGIADFSALGASMSHVGGNTVITLDATHRVTLMGVTPGTLVASDFLFA